MAALENIRNRSGLLLTVIGIAMLAFIGGDLMQSTRSGGGSIYVGEVLGESVTRQAYELKVEEGINNWKSSQTENNPLTQTITAQIRSQVWDQYVRDLVMSNEFEKLGIDVSDDEFFELLQGVNVHPEISKVPSFQNQITGQFDRTKVLAYLKQIDQDQTGEARARWVNFQSYLIGLIKDSKYNSLVKKAMYVTDKEADISLMESSQNIFFNYVAIPFSSVTDSIVEPNNEEIKECYLNNKADYEQDASKDVDFVVFTVTPSEEDDVATKYSINELKSDFAIYEDYNLMARRNSDNTNTRFTFATKDELQDPNWLEIFDSEEGSVIGPYFYSEGVYRIAKLAAAEYRPDSVEARHILISPTQNMSLDSIKTRINLIKKQIENGSDFGVLAESNSDDKGSSIKGGDLGWFSEGTMVDEFNEACFTSKRGDLSVVTSQFGVHLIEVTQNSRLVRKVKIAFIDRNVEPSTETFNGYYSQAAQFAGRILNDGILFDSLIEEKNLVKRSDTKVKRDKQNIVGLPNSREMVRWMNSSDVGTVSEVFQFENSYVVAYLTKENDEGIILLEDIKEEIRSLALNINKASYIIDNIEGNDLATIASKTGQTVVTSKKANLANLSLPGIGYEPSLVGSIFGLDIGSISKPIKGKNAVYIVEVISKDGVEKTDNYSIKKQEIQRALESYSTNATYKVLNLKAEVEDNRFDFY